MPAEYSPLVKIGACRHCRDHRVDVVMLAGKLTESAHCANWFPAFPNGCPYFYREPGADDDLETR